MALVLAPHIGLQLATTMSISALLNLVGAFTGTQEGLTIEDYLENFERVAALGGWTDGQMIDIMKLKCLAEAKDFIKSDPDVGAAVTWIDFKNRLRKRFKAIESPVILVQNFLECVQKPGESVQSYTTRLRAAGAKTVKTTDSVAESLVRSTVMKEQMLAQFLKGLRGNVKRFVLAGAPVTFEGAVVKAVQEEQNEKSVGGRAVGMAGVPSTTLDTHIPPPLAEPAQIPVQCQICNKRGHIALTCWKREAPNQEQGRAAPLVCQLCNRVGHEAKTCRVVPAGPKNGNPRKPANPPQPTCQLCEAIGHTAQACRPQGSPEVARGDLICYRCRQPGHYANQCSTQRQPPPNEQATNPRPQGSRQ